MDRNHLLLPVDRLSGAAAAGHMSHSWNQERSASQPLSPIANLQSPFPPSPLLPASSDPSPPSTPFSLLPSSPLPSPDGGAFLAAEFQLLQAPSTRFPVVPLQRRQPDGGRKTEDDDNQSMLTVSTLSTSDAGTPGTTTSYSPISAASLTPTSSATSAADMSAPPQFRSGSKRLYATSAPSAITPTSPSSATRRSPVSSIPLSCYATFFSPPPLPDGESSHPSQRPLPRPILWPSLSPVHLPSASELASLSFNCLDHSDDQLLLYSLLVFEHLNLVSALNLSLPHLQTFLLSIRAHYRVNPYHNWYHGFHVFQFGFYMLTHSRLHALLSPMDQLALLVSCLCHDVDHPGTTNDFQIAIESGLARVHNEVAVLENHHAFMTCEILRHPLCNFFTAVTAQQFRAFRKTVVAAILATDMAVHFDLCRQFRRFDHDLAEYKVEKEDDRQLVLNLVVHSSDLSAQVMDFAIASQWEARVTAEFIAQNAMETSLGVPVTPLMIGLHDHTRRFEKHISFLHFVMQPLWDVVADVMPPMQQCLDSLNANKDRYKQRLAQLTAQRDEERQPIINATALSSSQPSSLSASATPSAAVSVTVTPSATTAPTPIALSPRGTAAVVGVSSPPLSPSFVYHTLREEDEAADEAVEGREGGKDER